MADDIVTRLQGMRIGDEIMVDDERAIHQAAAEITQTQRLVAVLLEALIPLSRGAEHGWLGHPLEDIHRLHIDAALDALEEWKQARRG